MASGAQIFWGQWDPNYGDGYNLMYYGGEDLMVIYNEYEYSGEKNRPGTGPAIDKENGIAYVQLGSYMRAIDLADGSVTNAWEYDSDVDLHSDIVNRDLYLYYYPNGNDLIWTLDNHFFALVKLDLDSETPVTEDLIPRPEDLDTFDTHPLNSTGQAAISGDYMYIPTTSGVYRIDLTDPGVPDSPIVTLEDLGVTWEDASLSSVAIDEAKNSIVYTVRMSYLEAPDLYIASLDSPSVATLVYEMSDDYAHAQSMGVHPDNGNIIIGTAANSSSTAAYMLEVDPESSEIVCEWGFSIRYYGGLYALSVH